MKKITWHLTQTDDKQFPIVLEAENKDGHKSIYKRWRTLSSESCNDAVSLAVREALSSKHDYGNDKVKLIITGKANFTGCYLATVTINF